MNDIVIFQTDLGGTANAFNPPYFDKRFAAPASVMLQKQR